MMKTTRFTEKQLNTFARKEAKRARKAREAGNHEEAERIVKEAAGKVEVARAA